jgi:L-ascorbate metabolism protein UlaG (beta-lactamase superfamily)
MELTLIRNATMKLTYSGQTILTDPMFAAKDEFKPFAGVARNPTVELPFNIDKIIEGVGALVVSHKHPDHFYSTASKALQKKLPVFCQPGDDISLKEEGFQNVIPIEASCTWHGITITRTDGQHGSGKALEITGKVSGFVFQAEGELTVYWVGDSIWCEPVEHAIKTFKPDIIITHSGGATIPGFELLIMDSNQTIKTANSFPEATVVAIHMEALDHCPVSREELRQKADKEVVQPSRLMIPKDGETIAF